MEISSFVLLLRAVAIAGGGGALALSTVAWAAFRGSPFGHLLALLSVLLGLFTGLSIVSLLVPDAAPVVEFVEAVTYTWLAVFALMLLRTHDRLARLPRRAERD